MAALNPASKPEEGWTSARLIPTTGIGGQDDQERRATSSLLAVMRAVPPFGRAVVQHLGAPAGRLTTYTEVRFEGEDAKLAIPDGAIVIEWGKRRWVCLVEVKTSGAPLVAEQVARYLELARINSFDAVLTISNQLTTAPTESPIVVSHPPRKVLLRHLSWWHVMTEARVQHRFGGITNADQEWILGELIAYLDHEKAGAGGFDDMGDRWVAVRDGARQRTLRPAEPGVRDVASRWEQFVEYLALGLYQDLGRAVTPNWPKKAGPAARLDLLVETLARSGRLEAAIHVPDAVAPIELEADLGRRWFTTSIEVNAPEEGWAKTRINWIVRQLGGAPDDLRLDVRYPNIKEPVSGSLKDVRAKPERLLYAADPHRPPRTFRLSLAREMGAKRGNGPGSFVRASRQQSVDFYRSIVQHLRPWAASAPKLPEAGSAVSSQASPTPPDFSAPDARDFGEATEPES
ncbi:MAG: stress response protein [Candidatus Limnocylindrales bacterium]